MPKSVILILRFRQATKQLLDIRIRLHAGQQTKALANLNKHKPLPIAWLPPPLTSNPQHAIKRPPSFHRSSIPTPINILLKL